MLMVYKPAKLQTKYYHGVLDSVLLTDGGLC